MTEYPSRTPRATARYAKEYRCGYRRLLPGWPATRRIQALQAIGYTLPQIAEGMGCHLNFVYKLSSQRATSLNKELDANLRRFYDTHMMQPQHNGQAAKKARAAAKRHGWAPPYAWDDIDELMSQPVGALGPNGKPACDVCGSDRRQLADGMCPKHYQRAYRARKAEEAA